MLPVSARNFIESDLVSSMAPATTAHPRNRIINPDGNCSFSLDFAELKDDALRHLSAPVLKKIPAGDFLTEEQKQKLREFILSKDVLKTIIPAMGLIYYDPEKPDFVTKDGNKALLEQFFKEVKLPPHTFIFPQHYGGSLRKISLPGVERLEYGLGGDTLQNLGGRQLHLALFGHEHLVSSEKFKALLTYLGLPVISENGPENSNLKQQILKWGLKQSQESLNSRGIFLDEASNKAYFILVPGRDNWNTPLKIIKGNDVHEVDLLSFPNHDYNKRIIPRIASMESANYAGLNGLDELKTVFSSLGFTIASPLETLIFAANNQAAKDYIATRFSATKVGKILNSHSLEIAKASLEALGYSDIQEVESDSRILLSFKHPKMASGQVDRYLALVKASQQEASSSPTEKEMVINEAKKLQVEDQPPIVPAIVYVDKYDAKTQKSNIRLRKLGFVTSAVA